MNGQPVRAAVDFDEDVIDWPLDRLIDHIESTHHEFVRAASLRIARYLTRLVAEDGERHPELVLLNSAFRHLRADLEQHLAKEEDVLFPYVRQLFNDDERLCGYGASPFGSIQNPIRMMEREHQAAADELLMIEDLTCGYRVPADVSSIYAVCMSELKAFEADLRRHVHLESEILFPKAVMLEQRRFQ
jgi:regulator of cell morphogenesis and NO signaling